MGSVDAVRPTLPSFRGRDQVQKTWTKGGYTGSTAGPPPPPLGGTRGKGLERGGVECPPFGLHVSRGERRGGQPRGYVSRNKRTSRRGMIAKHHRPLRGRSLAPTLGSAVDPPIRTSSPKPPLLPPIDTSSREIPVHRPSSPRDLDGDLEAGWGGGNEPVSVRVSGVSVRNEFHRDHNCGSKAPFSCCRSIAIGASDQEKRKPERPGRRGPIRPGKRTQLDPHATHQGRRFVPQEQKPRRTEAVVHRGRNVNERKETASKTKGVH
eukprot:scaffold116_cov334-Pavlova_lutheri.AAC.62